MRKTLIRCACLLLAMPGATGQYVRLNRSDARNALLFNYDRVWDYNLYEKSRWGGGLRYDLNFGKKAPAERLSLEGYVAYGYEDQRFKGGLQADLQGRAKGHPHVYTGYIHDLTPDAARMAERFSLSGFSSNAHFLARRFSETDRMYVGLGWNPSEKLEVGLEGRLSYERRLFDQVALYYPTDAGERSGLPLYSLLECRLSAKHEAGVQAEVLVGKGRRDAFGIRTRFPFYAHALVAYDTTLKGAYLDISTHAQAGITSDDTPYSRLFDLGGIEGSPLLFSRSLVTARQNEFTANLFAMAIVKLGLSDPLFKYDFQLLAIGTRPRPFVQAGALWGRLWGENDDGMLWHDEMDLQAPSKGLAEVGIGIEGLLRWGLVDWGVALFFRLVPEQAFYHLHRQGDNRTLLLTASISL